jgi:hypothetical protein
MSYTKADLKKLFRKKIKVKAGGPIDKTRGQGLIDSLDAIVEFAEPTGTSSVSAADIFENLEEGTGIDISLTPAGKILIACTVSQTGTAPTPVTPTVTGFLPGSAAVGASVTITGTLFTKATSVLFNGTPASFQVINATTIVAVVPVGATTGPVSVATATATGTSAADFTVNASATTPTNPTATKATAPYFGTIDDVNNVVTLGSAYSFTEVRWGVEGQGPQALPSNSICSPGNIAGRLFAYVIADTATNRLQSDTVYSGTFTLATTAPTNSAPTVTLSSPQAGQTLAVGDPVVLNADPQDADGSSDIKRVDFLDNGVKFTETTVAPHTVQRPLTAGAHSFTARVYDMVGASGLSNAVQVTAQAVPSGNAVPVPPKRTTSFAYSTTTRNLADTGFKKVMALAKATLNGQDSYTPGAAYNTQGVWSADYDMGATLNQDLYPAIGQRATTQAFIDATGADNQVPHMISLTGVPQYKPFSGSARSSLSSPMRVINMAYNVCKKEGNFSFYQTNKAKLDSMFNAIPLDPTGNFPFVADVAEGEPGTVVDGFLESFGNTGAVANGCGRRYGCLSKLIELNNGIGNYVDAQAFADQAAALKVAFNDPANELWNDTVGMCMMSTIKNKERIDINSTCLAWESGLLSDANSLKASQYLVANYDDCCYQGQPFYIPKSNEYQPGVQPYQWGTTSQGLVSSVFTTFAPSPGNVSVWGYNQYQQGNAGWGCIAAPGFAGLLALTNQAKGKEFMYVGLLYCTANDSTAYPEWGSVRGSDNYNYVATASVYRGCMTAGGTDPVLSQSGSTTPPLTAKPPKVRYQFAQETGNFTSSLGTGFDIVRYGAAGKPVLQRGAGPGSQRSAKFNSYFGEYGVMATSPIDFSKPFAKRSIFKLVPNGSDQVLFMQGRGFKKSIKLWYEDATRMLRLQTSSTGAAYDTTIGAVYTGYGWTNDGMTSNGSTVAIQINGQIFSADNIVGGKIFFDPTEPLFIGTDADNPGNFCFNGGLCIMDLFDYVLPLSEFPLGANLDAAVYDDGDTLPGYYDDSNLDFHKYAPGVDALVNLTDNFHYRNSVHVLKQIAHTGQCEITNSVPMKWIPTFGNNPGFGTLLVYDNGQQVGAYDQTLDGGQGGRAAPRTPILLGPGKHPMLSHPLNDNTTVVYDGWQLVYA